MYWLKQGILIALEGVDGSGKSTLSQSLSTYYSTYYNTLHTKEPGGSPLGSFLRAHLQQQKIPTCSKAEFLLFAADRAQHFQEVIIPALEQKKLIFSDRLADSSLVYQGFGRELDRELITRVNQWAMETVKPHVTLYVKVPLEVALSRLQMRNQTPTAFEHNRAFFEKIMNGFDILYKNRKDVIILDGNQTKENVLQEALTVINNFLVNFC